ncbi:flavodoxin family protein [Cohnella sp. AR92]|uniref:flavodoxin family protein n=1 Tax=Cohnella sp. AR92 TaxID=648716 RepID=UPI000F8C6453|nr:flavodoxin family protein [Cohnella sp. AR92]RUS45113.1 flavodoxin family protein [Cohnella sp. AR92]
MRIAVIYGGTRANGNTELLAERVVAGLQADRIHLKDYTVYPIEDLRHAEGGFQEVGDDYSALIDRVLQNDILVFATPIYWYGMSGSMKNFVDRWSQTLRDADRPRFRERMSEMTAYVVAVGGDRPRLKGLPLALQFQHIFDFFGARYAGYLLGEGNRPGEILDDEEALRKAELWNEELKEQAATTP